MNIKFYIEVICWKTKKTEKIVENLINRFLSEELGLVSDENFISINPDMNLGEESPLELA